VVSLVFVFWIFVVLFGIIGGMRGWARELLVTSASSWRLPSSRCWIIMPVLQIHQGGRSKTLLRGDRCHHWPAGFLWLSVGQHRPVCPKMAREKIQDMLLGVFMVCSMDI